MKTIKCDVLIIGSGAAGLRTAIEAHDNGTDVLIATKSKKKDPHTILATGGINASLGYMDPQDNWLLHAYDTMKEGWHIANSKAVETLCKKAPEAVLELVKWGARFHRDSNGKLVQRFFGAQIYRRAFFYGDYTGREVIRVLFSQVKKKKIKLQDEVYIVSLLKNGNQVNGALGIDLKRGKLVVYHAKAVILAAGGYSRIYRRSSSRNYENFGDGIKIAFDAGAELMDMEMVQFHPTGMIWPPEADGTLVTEAVRGEGGKLYNANNERFMKKYDPKRMELSARDIVARANYMEILEGRGTEHGGVWLDVSHLSKKEILQRLPRMYKQFKDFLHLDISKQRMEVAPISHYSMGGIKVNHSTGETNAKGLFAVGEVTSGLHGANRLGGNSLAETLVFGKLTGKFISKFVKKNKLLNLVDKKVDKAKNEIEKILKTKSNVKSEKLKFKLQETMWEHVGIIRDKTGLLKALDEIEKLKKYVKKVGVINNLKKNQHLIDVLDLKAMIVCAEAVVKSALMRKESRGAHYRKDYLKLNNKLWKANILCKKNKARIKFYKNKIVGPKGKLKEILKKDIKVEHHLLE